MPVNASQALNLVVASATDETMEARRAAGRVLDTALRASGAIPLLKIGDGVSPAITVTVPGTTLFWAATDLTAQPAPDAAQALQQALLRWNVRSQVSMIDLVEPALRIALDSADEARNFAELVLTHLPNAHAAAHRLRTVLAAADITANSVRVSNGAIELGDVSAEVAVTLHEVLDNSACDDLDLEDWHDLETLAARLGALLRTTVGVIDAAVANPSCSSCSRSHEVTLGRATPDQVRLLADAIEAARTPHPLPALCPGASWD